jgi:hypothetical protein
VPLLCLGEFELVTLLSKRVVGRGTAVGNIATGHRDWITSLRVACARNQKEQSDLDGYLKRSCVRVPRAKCFKAIVFMVFIVFSMILFYLELLTRRFDAVFERISRRGKRIGTSKSGLGTTRVMSQAVT